MSINEGQSNWGPNPYPRVLTQYDTLRQALWVGSLSGFTEGASPEEEELRQALIAFGEWTLQVLDQDLGELREKVLGVPRRKGKIS